MGRKLQCQTQHRDDVQPATSELAGCPSASTTGLMDRGTTGTDDETGGFRRGFICHPDLTSHPRYIYLLSVATVRTVRSHCPSGVRGRNFLPLQYMIIITPRRKGGIGKYDKACFHFGEPFYVWECPICENIGDGK